MEAKGFAKEALSVARDPDYRFDLAIQTGDTQSAREIAERLDAAPKWRQLGELAMAAGDLDAAAACLGRADDLAGLLLLHAARGQRGGLGELADRAAKGGRLNVAFLCSFLLGDVGVSCCGG